MGTENNREESASATPLNRVETGQEWFPSNPRLVFESAMHFREMT